MRKTHMSKTVLPSKRTEWKELDRISEIVHSMNCIWREMTKDDFGLDGEIEVVIPKPDGKGLETSGQILKVQAKAGDRYVVSDTENSFASPVEKNDLEYWHKYNFPVLFIVYHPSDNRLYCKEIKTYLRIAPDAFAKPYRIRFDKKADIFGTESKDLVCRSADTSPQRISFDQKERLFTNLLPVTRLPRLLYRAKTRKRSWQAIKEESEKGVPPGCIVDGRIYGLTDPMHEKSALRKWCTKSEKPIAVTEWINNPERFSDFVFLLNQLLGKHMGQCGIRYNPKFKRNYFPRENKTELQFSRPWKSERTNVGDTRTVAKWYEYGLDKFWRHLAAETAFRRMETDWFLEIVPKYFFTTDGEIPWDSDSVGPYTTTIKAQEYNSHVLNHVLFWSDILSRGKQNIRLRLFGQTIMVIQKLPLFLVAPFAIPDDPTTFEEKPPPRDATLFKMDKTDEEDGDA